MEKGIKKILSRLKLEYAFLWAAVIVLVILYEGEVLPSGTFVEDAQAVYILQSAAILLTLGLIPLSLRLFTLSVCRNIRNYLPADALKSYRRWSEIRLALLITPLLFDISVYYATMNTMGVLCAGMIAIALLFCIPSENRLYNELGLLENKNKN